VESLLVEPLVGRPKDPVANLEKRISLLEDENQKLHRRLSLVTQRLAEAEGRDPQLALDELIQQLQESELERLRKEQLLLAAEAKAKKADDKKRKKPKRGHGPRPQEALPVVEETFELPDEQAECTVCGGHLVPLGEQFEESEDIHVVERRYVKRLLRRRKYRCQCNACVVTAPSPPRVIPGGRYSPDFCLQVAADKWLDHIPLERQVRIMERQGLIVGSQTLFDQAHALAELLRPIYDRLGELVLEAPVLHADETRWPRLDKKANSNWTVWTRTTPEIAHYSILASKSRSAADTIFAGYRGVIVADGYQVYESLVRDGPDLDLVNCWAHVRRKFADLRENFPRQCAEVLTLIRELYDVEEKIKGPFPGDADAQSQRLKLRKEASAPLLEKIKVWASTVGALPRSELGKSVRYMLKRWKALSRFLEDGRIPLDNNAAERSLRGPVVGRKVHYGSKSKKGTEVAAIFYTLFETAKLCGVEPVGYVREAMNRALHHRPVILPQELVEAPSGSAN